MEHREEDVRLGANKYSERQAIGIEAQSQDKDYKEPPPAPLFEPGELMSWSFYRAGIAEVNVTSGEIENRLMMTGMHTVADIFCVCCGSIVGWKYETAHEKSQKYKEGKSVLERFKIAGPDGSHYWASHDTHVAGSDADDV